MSHYSGSIPDSLAHAADWLEYAACKTVPEVMFPDSNTGGIAAAKMVCRPCPVRLACLRDAIRTGDDQHGIRGAWIRVPTADYVCPACGETESASGDQVAHFAAHIDADHRSRCTANPQGAHTR